MTDEKRQIRLLIVDDDEKLLKTMAERLVLNDFDVTTASEGKHAIKAAKKGRFDVAIVDLKMPGMDGIELLTILKKKHKFLEIIILTGFASLESAVECTKLGAFGYIEKPFKFDSLLEKLKEAYTARLNKKFEYDTKRKEDIKILSLGSPLAVLNALRRMDDYEK